MKSYDVCIIGAGAAGLAAAARLDDNITICILEKNRIPGRKIMATGGGRCNITNVACENSRSTLEFFKLLGLETHHDDEGRCYPYSNQASDVVRILMDEISKKNAEILTEFAVSCLKRREGGFLIGDEKGRAVTAANVILAPGGKAAPQFGTTGDGYAMARSLGHETTRVYPILTGIECGDFKKIKGIRAKGEVRLFRDDRLVKAEKGEIQFTEDGISGICVFDITPDIRTTDGEDFRTALKRYHLELDLAPDFTREELADRQSSFGILSEKLSEAVALQDMKAWRLAVKGIKGWKNAQCTAGGVALDGVDLASMQSKIVPGLYFAGEILDIQGPCGGYNLQNAWETGMKAAEHINGRYR